MLWAALLVSTLLDVRASWELQPAPAPADAEEVAAIVPARNEAHQIGPCLRSLLAQDWPRLRVVCVDDRSEDATFAEASAIADARLTVVRGEELPAGWLGKNHANAQGVAHAPDAAWFLFTDADTVHAPGGLPASMAAARASGADLFTLFSEVRAESFWERALMTHVLATIVAAFPVRWVNDARKTLAIANGQYILVRRAAYEAVGGHAAIRDRVADDLELARLIKGSGRVLRVEDGRRAVSVRMYTSLHQIWWGFVKNASAGSGGPLVAVGGIVLTALTALPFFVAPFLHGAALALALAGIALALAQRFIVFAKLFPISPLWGLTLPLAQPLFAGILGHSALRQLAGKGPRWKGRDYPHGR